MYYPVTRLRRLRQHDNIRRMVRETHLSVNNLVYPLFICHGQHVKKEIGAMPGNYQMSVDLITEECKKVRDLGIPAVILFGIPEAKDATGSEAVSENGIIQRTLRAVKKEVPDLMLITDVCMCEYTDHGHCGIIKDHDVHNDDTLTWLARQAVTHAHAGADMIAPSDMMDGRVGAIRKALDGAGYTHLPIMSYAAKYASAYYGPFREAAGSAPQFGDRKTYQMDPSNSDEAMREIALDIEEGADIIMVKPATPCLDIIYRASTEYNIPVAAYNVSGEYAMVTAAAQQGWIDKDKVMMEMLLSVKRAGADIILTYFAKEAARRLIK